MLVGPPQNQGVQIHTSGNPVRLQMCPSTLLVLLSYLVSLLPLPKLMAPFIAVTSKELEGGWDAGFW